MKKHLLMQLQLSNIINGEFSLSGDSGWQMCAGRARQMLKLNPELTIDFVGPKRHKLVEQPENVNPDLFVSEGVRYIDVSVPANALATRYNFSTEELVQELKSMCRGKYDAVYINDPLLLRHYKAAFLLGMGYTPKFFVHSHFVDCVSNPKFPAEASLWLGQVEAALRADYNFWQCQTALDEFERDARNLLVGSKVDEILAKSAPYDDGYSIEEITQEPNLANIRFDKEEFLQKMKGKVVLFFPNRISPSSSDFTRGMKFFFELLPQLYQKRQDFIVIAGNPNQKFSNNELEEKCGKYGYLKISACAFNRDEYKWIVKHSHISIHAYAGTDTYGGTAMRECIELGCCPIMMKCNEYEKIAKEANWDYVCKTDFSDFIEVISKLIDKHSLVDKTSIHYIVRQRCSYESTTEKAMKIMNLL